MTNQEAFTTVVLHLRKQGRRSTKPGGPRSTDAYLCYYRAGNLKCAVGALIPDEQYTPRMEGLPVRLVQRNWPVLKGISPSLLSDLQITHDFSDPKEWENQFTFLAQAYELEVPKHD